MNDLGNKKIFAQNLQRFLDEKKIDRQKMCDDLGFKYSTVSMWLQAQTYPRIDKIESMAEYFKIDKADLIEHKNNQNHHSDITQLKLEGVYLNFAKEAQDEGIDPDDIKMALDFIKKTRNK